MIITIDGPASVGKGTLASRIADFYSLAYFDTGMVYRATTLEMILDEQDITNEELAETYAKKLTFRRMLNLSKLPEFRGVEMGKKVAIVASHTKVRKALLNMQRDFAKKPILEDGSKADGVVYDGRDTGTVVMPEANLKLFVTASSEIRAERRLKEFQARGMETTYEEVLHDIRLRDEKDSNREFAPLKAADDAIIIDTSDMNAFEVFEHTCEIVEQYI